MTAALLVVLSGCDRGKRDPSPKGTDPVSEERLHKAGELRLTSAGRSPRLLLRYRLMAGDLQGYQTTVRIHHQSGDRVARMSAILIWERQVIATREDKADVRLKVRHVRRTRPSALRDGLKQRLAKLDLALTIDRRGRIHSAPRAPLPGKWVARSLSRLSAPLPKDAVGDGATWERYEPVDLTLPRTRAPVRLGVRTTYRLIFKKRRGEERVAIITARLQLAARSGASKKPGPRLSGGGKGTSEIQLDLRTGLVTRCSSTQTLDLELTQHLQKRRLKQTVTTQTRKVKLRPRPPTRPKQGMK